MSKRVVPALTVVCGLFVCLAAQAQTAGNVVRVYTNPAGVAFSVDGQTYYGQASFPWPANSKHVVTSQNLTSAGTNLTFKGWVTNLNSTAEPSMAEPITADPALQWIELVFDSTYSVTIMLVDCPDPTQPCLGAGTVQVNGVTYDRKTVLNLEANSQVDARAFPNSGYIFTGWAQIDGLRSRGDLFRCPFTLTGATELAPYFQPTSAAQVQTNIQTVPPNMQVYADSSPFTGPVSLEWGWGTTHTIGTNPVQQNLGV